MNKTFYFILLINFSITACQSKKVAQNQFENFPDTLKLKTEKIKGCGKFSPGAANLSFINPLKSSTGLKFIIPSNFENAEVASFILDPNPKWYLSLINGKLDSSSYSYLVHYFHFDTSKISHHDFAKNYVSILRATLYGKTILVIDQNNNCDFSDDTIRSIHKINFFSSESLIKFAYNVYNGSAIVPSYSWINIGPFDEGKSNLLYFFSEHRNANFTINNKSYTLAVYDKQWKSVYLEPRIALTMDNAKIKDTIPLSEIYKLDEYIKIDSIYYRFQGISNDGSIIILIKEKEFENKIGTQVGMKAPDFKLTTVNNQNISLQDYKNKYLLIVNTTYCGKDETLFKSYQYLIDSIGANLKYLCLDYTSPFFNAMCKSYSLKGDFVLLTEKNKNEILNSYRPDYSSLECFLISPEGRIVDKFELDKWKNNLSSYLK